MPKPKRKPSNDEARRSRRSPAASETQKTIRTSDRKAKTRQSTKQAKVIAMLRRPGGATIADLAKATGWQDHTVRGMLSGALKKKLGLMVTSSKSEGKDRVYRLA